MYLLTSLYSPHAQEQENVMKGTWTNNDRTRNLKKEVGSGSLCWMKLREKEENE